MLPAEVASDAHRLARLEREAQVAASLSHPGIVTLFSVEDADGTRFLTMELVEGQSLARHVTPGGLPIERVVELGIALADALAAAHEKGVVHRDLKPANVMLTREGRVKVLDFGLAKLAAAGLRRPCDARRDPRRTPLGRGSRGGHGAVHGAGAAARRGRRRPHGPVRPRGRALRARDGAAAVRGRDGGCHQQRDPARRAGAAGERAERRARRPRPHRRALPREGAASALPDGPRRGERAAAGRASRRHRRDPEAAARPLDTAARARGDPRVRRPSGCAAGRAC